MIASALLLLAGECAETHPSFARAEPAWPVGAGTEMNGFVRFEAWFERAGDALPVLRVSGSSVYRIRLNGAFVGYGPARAAKGWFRVDEWELADAHPGLNLVEIEVSVYNCGNFYIPKQPGFLQAEIVAGDRVLASTPHDFRAFDTGRIKTVSRYSFQRGFCEAYRLPHAAKELRLETRPAVRLLERIASYPEFRVIRDYRPVAGTDVRWATNLQYRANRFVDNVDNVKIDGYASDKLEFNGWEAVWKWQVVGKRPVSGMRFNLSSGKGMVFASPVDRCGFFGFHVNAKTPVRLFALFDEFADGDAVDATRALSANSIRWDLAPGEYDLETFEPYMAAGLHILVDTGEAEIDVPFLREYASPDATVKCPVGDPVLKSVFEAARESFRANAVDVFTDCPGRERAGWLCDSFFTGRSAFLFTGSTKLERLFLQNFLLPDRFEHLPEGMLPMCYPGDHADGVYIPNWTFWLVLELEEYLQRSGDRAMIDAFKPKMMALLRFFEKYENVDGLLEKLPGWVFVEWSKANELVQDVNYPSNATWASTLDALARMYSMPELSEKARRIRERIREQAWNGEWFADNATRMSDGSLRRGDVCTEVCQYYMFLFGVASPETHPALWRRLVDGFGPDRESAGRYPEIPAAAEFIGNYLRLEILSRAGLGEQVLREMRGYFKKMVDKTGTLWELSGRSSSKNHGFASYAACWIARHASDGKEKVSPDGRNRIEYREGCITVSRDGKTLFGPQPVSLSLDRGEASVELVARDDGVAYRFVSDVDGEITVNDETCALVFPSADTEIWAGYNWCDNPRDPKQDKLQHGCASIYTKTTPCEFASDGRRIAYLPLTVRFDDGTTVLFSESDLRDYAGLHLRRNGGEARRLDGVFGKYPVREKEWTAPCHYRRVRDREGWIVKTLGRRTFPWRVFAIASTPAALMEQRLVYDLASPAQGDFSWVKSGPCAWDWWSKWHLEDVPFKPGINTDTYRHYADFAAEFKLPWMIVDEGWKQGDDLYAETPGFDLGAVLSHAAARNVQVMLWTAWRSIDGRQEEYFSHFAKRGVKGFKIDFMERDDAEMMRFMEETLKVAAKYRLCIDFHGCGKPTGLEKTYPNLVGIEGVHGLELMKLSFAKDDDFPAHDCQVAFTRAPLGMVDYTPGAMMNRTRGEWRPNDASPASQGTRVHQMALYTMFPVPLQMLCDSPSRYRANPDCARFIASVPTVWDETKGLAGEIGKFAVVARRNGDEWWVGAITDWSPRTLALDTAFLKSGEWDVEIFADADDSASMPERWTKCSRRIRAGEKIQMDLAPGGGWTARLSPVSRYGVFLEAEAFSDKGGWTVDCQHSLQMGSPYLLAHGLGKPVANAHTSFVSERGGSHRMWVRTRNWTANWSSHAAGLFRVRLNGEAVGGMFGAGSAEWSWVGGAMCDLLQGTNVLELVDETGFDGRIDAIAFTCGEETPDALAELFRGRDADCEEMVSADLVVVGGGVAGTCAALAAARSGLKVALVQDRPVLGGNNSSEVRVHMGGHMQCGEYPHLGDIVAEISPEEGGNASVAQAYEDDRKLRIVEAEPNIALFLNTKADGVEMASNRIAAVRAFDVVSGRRLRFTAPLFVDSTGDGTIGFLAGADYRSGRESKAETGEPSAPGKADSLTMGASCQWRAAKTDGATSFPIKPWMLEFDDKSATFGMKGDWDWETGLGRDQIAEAERIRDYGMLVAYSNWGFVKNRSSRRGEFADARLDWVASVAGKRESRRLMGDVVLDETDIMTARPYPDATCLTSWSIDLHYPKDEEKTRFAGESFRTRCEQRRIALYPIPLGCLYSRNVGNLFMAGRNISVTHIALGTVRVMRTTGMMGEVVGLAAAVCRERDCLPRDVRRVYFGELARRMKRGAGAGNAWSRQEYNVHPSLGLDVHDKASVACSKVRNWSNVDFFRGLTANEPGVLSNKLTWVSMTNGICSAFWCGETSPFATWGVEKNGLDMRVRLDEAHPFVYVDVAPRAASTNILAGVLSAPEIWAGGLGTNMVAMGSSGLGPVDAADPSCGYLAVAEPFTRRGIVAGWLTNFKASGAFSARKDSSTGAIGILPIVDYGRMRVKSGTQPQFDTFVIGAFDDCRLGLEAYADAVADRFAIRLPPNKTGYCSWSSDRYGASDRSRFASGCGSGTEESMLEFAAAAEKLVPYGFEFVQVDDQWQNGTINNGPAKDWSGTNPHGGYPNGFGAFIDCLRRHGMTAGLWFIPFGGDAADEAWKGCEALYVKSAVDIPRKTGVNAFSEPVALPRRRGDPIKTVWGGECLDMTNPASRERLAGTVRRFTSEWGFRYLKCDGIFAGLGCDIYGGYDWKDVNFANAVFSDPDASNVSAYRLGLETIRRASAPGTFVLGCNLGTIRAMVPSFGLVDGMRVGNDNGPIGLDPMRYLEGPKAGTMRYFFNGRVWRSHPDSTFVRAALPAGRARLGASWTAISDSVFELGDWLPSLPEERVEILRRTMAHHGSVEMRPIDYFEKAMPNAWILDGGERKVIAIFNWSTNEVLSVDYDFSYAGLDSAKTYVGYDFWGKRPIGPMRDRISASVSPDDCLVFSCCEVSDREELVSTSLHVASPVYGAAEGRVLTIAGEPLEVRTYSASHGFRTFVVPSGSGGWIDFSFR